VPAARDVDEIRTALHEQRAAGLERELAAMVDAADSANLDDEHDPEGATVAFERAQVISLLEQARRQLDALEAAGARMAAGTHGTCARCGGPIAFARLVALPATDVCVACAQTGRGRRV
jgi:DnaK suppressor protein